MYRILFMGIGVPARHLPKLLRIMRLTTFLLFTAFMQVSAKGLAQKVSLNSHHASLKTVIKQLRQQSGYDFVYSEQLMELALPVDLHLTGADLEDALAVI